MRKKLFNVFLLPMVFIIIAALLNGCGTKSDNIKKVKLNEVVRSVFYAPMYAAINNGFFEEEGIEIELSTGQGADGTVVKTQVLMQYS